jgi:hypothetical protein
MVIVWVPLGLPPRINALYCPAVAEVAGVASGVEMDEDVPLSDTTKEPLMDLSRTPMLEFT